MAEAGVRELKTHASRIVRNVRDRRTRYVITYRGRPAALLGPLQSAPSVSPPSDAETAWEELVRLGREIGRGWRAPATSVELLSQMRR